MIKVYIHIRSGCSFPLRKVLAVCMLLLSFYIGKAQVITNDKAFISLSSGVSVSGFHFDNDAGELTNDGKLALSGNWVNSAVYNPASGTMEFDGSADQKAINTDLSSATFYKLVVSNTGVGKRVRLLNATTVVDSLTIRSGFLKIDSSFSCKGKSTISGTLFDSTLAGTNLFKGLVTIQNGGKWNFADANCPIELQGGLSNDGNFMSGAGLYSFTSNAQNLTALSPINFATKVRVTNNANVIATSGTITISDSLLVDNAELNTSGADFTVDNGVSVKGTLSDNSTDGSNHFKQLVKIYPGAYWNFSGNDDLEFQNSLVFEGAGFTSGTGTYLFSTRNQSITSPYAITIAGNVEIGAGLSLNNNIIIPPTGLTIQGTLNGLSASSQYNNLGITSYENHQEPMFVGKLNNSLAGNIFRYSGSDQIVASSSNGDYRSLVIAESGTKTFNGNVLVRDSLSIIRTATLAFGGDASYLLDVKGNLSAATGGIEMLNGTSSHTLKLYGLNNICSRFTADHESVVEYLGADNQQVFASAGYSNILFSGSGAKYLQGDVKASGASSTLTTNVITGASNTLYFANAHTVLTRIDGAVVGNLLRYASDPSFTYFYPVGSETSFHPLYSKFASLNPGAFLVSYKSTDPTADGLPINDHGNEVWDRFENGYWSTQAQAGLSSSNYKLSVNASDYGIDVSSRIVKKDDGSVVVNGVHANVIGDSISRDSLSYISSVNTSFLLGKGRPIIVRAPNDSIVCEATTKLFSMGATGQALQPYHWYKKALPTDIELTEGAKYTGTTSSRLLINNLTLSDSGYYTCIVTDAAGHNPKSTPYFHLKVNAIPKLWFADYADTLCNKNVTSIHFPQNSLDLRTGQNSDTLYSWTVTQGYGLSGASNGNGLSIVQQLANITDSAKKADYKLRAVGPMPTSCQADTSYTVWVEPTTKVYATPEFDTICNNTNVSLALSSPSFTTQGAPKLRYYAIRQTGVGAIVTDSVGLSPGHTITDLATNTSDSVKLLRFVVTPYTTYKGVGTERCAGITDTVDVKVNPTVSVQYSLSNNDSLCFNQGTKIDLSSRSQITDGKVKFKLTPIYQTGAFTGVTASGTFDLGVLDQMSLKNVSSELQRITYNIIPFISDAKNGLNCYTGNTENVILDVASELKFKLQPRQYVGNIQISCEGYKDGRLDVVDTVGGFHGYKYGWTSTLRDSARNSAANLPQGTYSVTVSDILGCSMSATETLKQPKYLAASYTIVNATCKNSNGSVVLNEIGGGTRPYRYVWKDQTIPVSTDSSLLNKIGSTKYYLNITDTNKCVYSNSYFINSAPSLTSANPNITSNKVSCYGYADGSFNVNLGSVAINYYRLTSVERNDTMQANLSNTTRFNISGLKGGNYRLYVRNQDECSVLFSSTYQIVQPSAPISYLIDTLLYSQTNKNIKCYNDANGRVYVKNNAGGYQSGNFLYVWTGPTGASIVAGAKEQTSLKAGTYVLKVRDLVSSTPVSYCEVSSTITLHEPDSLHVVASSPKYHNFEVSCAGGDNGSILLDTIKGGSSDYSFSWTSNNGSILASTRNQLGLKAGIYQVAVKYGNAECSKSYSYTLHSPDSILLNKSKSDIEMIRCFGENNGHIMPVASGGINLGYSWKWTALNGKELSYPTSQRQDSLYAGTYQVEVSDSNKCKYTTNIIITEPDSIRLRFISKPISCSNSTNGSLSVKAFGGVPDYSYLWQDGSKDTIIAQMRAGRYFVTVKDSRGCERISSDSISAPDPLQIKVLPSDYHGQNITCYGASDGFVKLNVTGGVLPYYYSWTSSATGEALSSDAVLSNVPIGEYKVGVHDINGCQGSAAVVLTQPEALTIEYYKTDLLCHSVPVGNATAIGHGGTMGYTYKWSTGATSSIIDSLYAGSYTVQVADSNKCIAEQLIAIEQPDTLSTLAAIINPNCPDASDGQVQIRTSGGVPPYRINWKELKAEGDYISDLKVGKQVYQVTDFNNCIIKDSVTLEPRLSSCLTVPLSFTPNNDGVNDGWVILAGDPDKPVLFNEMYPNGIVEVYSRWGTLLYQSEPGYPSPWDGKYHGKVLPLDSYYFVINPHNGRRPMKGIITIVK